MAEHIARDKFGERIEPKSAGLRPQEKADADHAVETLRLVFQIDASSYKPRGLDGVQLDQFDMVVTMDNRVAATFGETYPDCPKDRIVRWKIVDPWGATSMNIEGAPGPFSAE
jgi:protein-tyrosine-phosphatase